MSTDLSALSAEELAATTRAWLAEHLPAGWMEAVDAGDAAKVAALRAELDYAKWCTGFGESGLRDADLARGVRRRVVALAGPGACGERGAEPLQGAAALRTSSGSAWAGRR